MIVFFGLHGCFSLTWLYFCWHGCILIASLYSFPRMMVFSFHAWILIVWLYFFQWLKWISNAWLLLRLYDCILIAWLCWHDCWLYCMTVFFTNFIIEFLLHNFISDRMTTSYCITFWLHDYLFIIYIYNLFIIYLFIIYNLFIIYLSIHDYLS